MEPSPYLVGDVPVIDPCGKCLVKVVCTELCKEKILWNRANPKVIREIRVKVGKGRKNES